MFAGHISVKMVKVLICDKRSWSSCWSERWQQQLSKLWSFESCEKLFCFVMLYKCTSSSSFVTSHLFVSCRACSLLLGLGNDHTNALGKLPCRPFPEFLLSSITQALLRKMISLAQRSWQLSFRPGVFWSVSTTVNTGYQLHFTSLPLVSRSVLFLNENCACLSNFKRDRSVPPRQSVHVWPSC